MTAKTPAKKAASKPAAKAPAAKSAAKKTEAAAKPAAKSVDPKKAARDAERAKRFPSAAKAEAEKAAAKSEGRPAKTRLPKPAAVAFVDRQIKPGATMYAVAENGARPQSGSRLYAHTHAVLSVLGMLAANRPAVSQSIIRTVMGPTALKYHLQKGNFETAADHKVRVTTDGLATFKERQQTGKVDNKAANAFVDLFLTGKASADSGVAQANVFQVSLQG